jgi:hypothetical protein
MQQEAPQELIDGQRHQLLLVTMCRVAPAFEKSPDFGRPTTFGIQPINDRFAMNCSSRHIAGFDNEVGAHRNHWYPALRPVRVWEFTSCPKPAARESGRLARRCDPPCRRGSAPFILSKTARNSRKGAFAPVHWPGWDYPAFRDCDLRISSSRQLRRSEFAGNMRL